MTDSRAGTAGAFTLIRAGAAGAHHDSHHNEPTMHAKTPAADRNQTFGELARLIGQYRHTLNEFAAGTHGPLTPELASHLRGMSDNTGEELLILTSIHGRG